MKLKMGRDKGLSCPEDVNNTAMVREGLKFMQLHA